MEHFLLALPAVFFVVDPIAAVPLFLAMTARDSPDKARAMARRASIAGALLLIFFALFGGVVFRVFNVTLGAFRVAGGCLLFMTAMDMLRNRTSTTRTTDEETKEGIEKEDIAIVPLAIPLLSGPGSIATVMVLMAEGDGLAKGLSVITAILITFVATFFMLAGAQRLQKVLGKSGIAVLQRVFGLILASIAVEFVVAGGRALWAT